MQQGAAGNSCSLQPPEPSPEVESTGLMLSHMLGRAPPGTLNLGSQRDVGSVGHDPFSGHSALDSVTRHLASIRQGPKNPPLPAAEAGRVLTLNKHPPIITC